MAKAGKKKQPASEAKSVAETRELVKKALKKGEISWRLILLLGQWHKLDRAKHAEKRAVGERYYMKAVETFKVQHGAEVAVFSPVGGVYLLDDGELRTTVDDKRIAFDWSEASRLIFKIAVLAETAKEWWSNESSTDAQKSAFTSTIWRTLRSFRGLPSAEQHAGERKLHSMRAYGLATRVLGEIRRENAMHRSPSQQPPPPPTDLFKATLSNLQADLRDAQHRFNQAAQRAAQSRYWRGMLVGGMLLSILCLIAGALFWWRDVDAAFGIAAPAGGVGAMVSVLQRMSSGKMMLDFEAGRDLLEVFGAVRPFIGAIFGLAVMALLLGGLVPAIEAPPNQELAFFAGVGFLAGFNERWAQDMLNESTAGLKGSGPGKQRGAEGLQAAK